MTNNNNNSNNNSNNNNSKKELELIAYSILNGGKAYEVFLDKNTGATTMKRSKKDVRIPPSIPSKSWR